MRRTVPKTDFESGQDSFLDVVSNIVGILIILVVIVGAQVKNGLASHRIKELQKTHADLELPEVPKLLSSSDEGTGSADGAPAETVENGENGTDAELLAEKIRKTQEELVRSEEERQKRAGLIETIGKETESLSRSLAQTQHLEQEIMQAKLQKERMDVEQTVFAQECVELETRLQLIRKEMESSTDAQEQKDREILLLTQESASLEKQIAELEARMKFLREQQAQNGGPKMIEHKMTPIVHSVDSREFHFILDRGRVLYVPLEELLKEYQRRSSDIAYSLMKDGRRTDVFGPYDGFRIHTETQLRGGQIGVYWKLLPPDIEEAGEKIEDAVQPISKFHHYLEKLQPGKDTVTFWIYPEGFATFPQIKEDAYRHGFAIASRPLPEGMPIAGSPEGQKSVAQ